MSKLNLEEKISNLESQSKRQGEKVSLLLEQVEKLQALSEKLLLLIEESLYESGKRTEQDLIQSPQQKMENVSSINFLKTIIENKSILN